ncbi:WD-40 repeat protein containing caspase catalytic domain [Sulfurimonas gotlandica GD1]|uniref:WD-40 repeat protein containing caspase catalytic domain n=1 Tax=Sulfurimonas gotlandica (strain DSM 19862 / JCM 16533 / GD1) TaxID=929558 RepID=B6BLG7_SULGG|nr:caspase family protein [Sulfurimonas gotlandica]EDZ62069.1 caspase domain protein [Sulfurimonas gotlandica GD1]EHP28622.1 WD-40 repeat protein containing caspase catalytic domain [Sulfurimonas gotlandica GD1]
MFKIFVSLVFILSFMVGCGQPEVSVKQNDVQVVTKKDVEITYRDPNFKITKPFLSLGHADSVRSNAITPDGMYLVTGGNDATIKIWNIQSGAEIKTLYANTDAVRKVFVTNDSKFIIAGYLDKKIIIWEIATGKKIREIQCENRLHDMFLNSDNQIIISVEINSDGTSFNLWNIQTGQKIKTVSDEQTVMPSVASTLLNDSEIVYASIYSLNKIDLNTGNIKRVKTERGVVYDMAASKDNKVFFIKSNNIQLWDLESNEIKDYYKDDADLYSIDLNKDYVVINNKNDLITMLDAKSGNKLRTIKASNHQRTTIEGLTLSENYIIQGVEYGVKIFDINEGKLKQEFLSKSPWVHSAVLSDDLKYVLSSDFKNNINFWDLTSGQKTKELAINKHISFISDLSDDNQYGLLVNSFANESRIDYFNIQSSKVIESFTFAQEIIHTALLFDKKYIIFDILQGDLYHPKSKINIFDIKSKKIINSYEKTGKINHMTISHSGEFLVTNPRYTKKRGSYLEVFTTKTDKVLHTFDNTGRLKKLTISSDDKSMLTLGDNNHITLWDLTNGVKLKSFDTHMSNIKDVKFTKDKKYIISAGLDGVIRYWDVKTGKEVLAKASFEDGEWVHITPEGYFNASLNGAKHLSILTGPMQVSSIDQYYETFYRPDIVASAMSEDKSIQYATQTPTLKLSDVKPAPQVAIIDTKKSINKEELQVTLKITPNSGGIGQIRLYLDGVLIKTDGDRGLQKKQDKNVVLKTYTIKLAKGKHTLKAIVYNEENTMASIEDTLAVTSTFNPIVKPNIYAVVIGINEYKNPSIALKYAVADAELFANTIKAKTKGLYGDVKVELLTSKAQTSKENITKTLKALETISPNDLFIFFVASHGMVEDAKYNMITSNVGALSTRGIEKEAISQNALRDMIANIPTTKKFIVLDTCNSGALGQTLEVALLTRGLTETTAMKVLSRAVGSTIISASSSSQEALEGYKGHGLLTYVLTDGLNGKADGDSDGYIKTLEIANFVEDTVPQIAEKEFKRAQYPFVSPLGQGFPLVKVK